MGLLDIAAGAAAGGGAALEKVGYKLIDEEIQRSRDDRLEEFRSKAADLVNTRTIEAEGRANTRTIEGEQRRPGNISAETTARVNAEFEASIAHAPKALQAEIARQTALNTVRVEGALQEFKALAPLKRQEAIDTEVAKITASATPDMLKATRAIAQSKHIVDPMYSLVPQSDGTVATFDARSGRTTGVLKDADGKPLIRKDPEELKAAVSVLNMASTNLKIAEAAYKADSASLEPGVKEKATIQWESAQREAKQISAPAFAVLYGKAKIPGVKTDDTQGTLPPLGSFMKGGKPTAAAGAATPAGIIQDPRASFVRVQRGGFTIDAPRRSPAATLNGKQYLSREEALAAIEEIY